MSQTLVEILEEYISTNKLLEKHSYLGMKINDAINGKALYTRLEEHKDMKQNYEIFGSNASGQTCFSLYRSINQNIYLFVVIYQEIKSYERNDRKTNRFFIMSWTVLASR